MTAALAEHVHQRARLLQRVAPSASRWTDHTLAEHGEVQELTAPKRQRYDLIVLDHILNLCRFQLHLGTRRLHDD